MTLPVTLVTGILGSLTRGKRELFNTNFRFEHQADYRFRCNELQVKNEVPTLTQ
ncbi:hypothetical protein [Nostoc sp.]|uniref:hypothetical protein n=1 Tax=Nostoc sp. TaxID=1180 RepID=UPI002FFAAE32